jgi:hypothetical protein
MTGSVRRVGDPASARRRLRSAGALLLPLLWTGCSDFLTVDNPGQIADRDLDAVEAISPLVAGAAGDFALAYRYTAINMALYSREFIHTGSFPSWRVWEQGVSRRPSSEANGLYNDIARAVWVADNTAERLRRLVDNPSASEEVAEVVMWGAFARFFYADNFCAATFDGGPPQSPQQIYAAAEAMFDDAIAVASAAGAQDIRRASLAGRARARLMQGNHAGAQADAAQIPAGFRYDVLYSDNSSREYNWVASYSRDLYRREVGVHPIYYTDPRYIADPRTPFIDRGPGAVGPDEIRQWVEQDKYRLRSTPLPITKWQEARLIEAEAELRLNNITRAIELIDELRLAVGLPAYDGPATSDAVFDQLLYERSAELWLLGHRFVDMRRTNDPYLQTIDACVEIGQREWETNIHLGGG